MNGETLISPAQIRVGQEIWDDFDQRWLRVTRIDNSPASVVVGFELGKWGGFVRTYGSISLRPGQTVKVRQVLQPRLF